MFNNWLMWGSSASRLAKLLYRCDDGNLSSSKESLIQLSRPSKHSEFYFQTYTLSNGDVVLPYLIPQLPVNLADQLLTY